MKVILAWMLLCFWQLCAYSQEFGPGSDPRFKTATHLFNESKYHATVEELNRIKSQIDAVKEPVIYGFMAYWKGIAFNRQQSFFEACEEFNISLKYGYIPLDIYYEYGQALFASEKLQEARLQFKYSLKKRFKRGVSLYYIAYISKELGEKAMAVKYYNAVSKLDVSEKKEVQQASEMQVADIYLEQTEKRKDAFRLVETYVIPQYEKAIKLDKKSALAYKMQVKIAELQKKYDLLIFQLRNGRIALNPPYFLKASAEYGQDSNVTFSPSETTVSKSKQASPFGRVDAYGRYTFYVQDYISLAPEMRYNYTKYYNRVPEIYRNDNYILAPALRSAYEHTLMKKQASVLVDYEYNETFRDVKAEKDLQFSSRSQTYMLGERFNYFTSGETIVRLRQRHFTSFVKSSNSLTHSFVLEQIKNFETSTFLFYFSYDQSRVKTKTFDTDSLTFRGDYIMGRVFDLFTPSVGIAYTSTDPLNDRANRGRETLLGINVRASKTFGKNWRGSLKFDYSNNDSKDTDEFAYKKNIMSAELEYLF